MKKILRRILTPIFLSVICGFICGKLVFQIYDNDLEKDLYGEKIYLIQSGAYSNYDNMVKNTSLTNYIYYEDDGLFKSVIGVTESKKNVEKITSVYGKEVIVNEYYSKDDSLNKKIQEYDKKLKNTTDSSKITEITSEILKLYKENKNISLIKVT